VIYKNLIKLLLKIAHYFISPIHPKMEIERNNVAPINKLGGSVKKNLDCEFSNKTLECLI